MRILSPVALFSAAVLLPLSASAKVDLTPYHLTPEQIETIHKFEAKGYSDDFIRRFAQVMQNDNERKAHPIYIPPHTLQDLQAVADWAAIGPFNGYIQNTHYQFDLQRYQKDCPSWAIFNFGRATGTQYFQMDVLTKAINASYALSRAYTKDTSVDKAEFQKAFDELADYYGVRPYLSTPAR